MDQVQLGTSRLTGYMMAMLGCRGKWFLPEPDPEENLSAGAMLQIREALENTGLLELDFDGKLHPTPEFARMAYNITHARGALCWQTADARRIVLRGPVDDLVLVCQNDLWTAQRRYPSALLSWAQTLAAGREPGTLAAMNAPEQAAQEACLSPDGGRAEHIAAMLDIYFGGGMMDA